MLHFLLRFIGVKSSLLLSHLLLDLLDLISELVVLANVHLDNLIVSIILHLKLIFGHL